MNKSKMVKKKSKSTKKLRKRSSSWTEEDVKASTSLPPQVEGQLRCYLKLSITQILWLIPSPPDVTHVRVKWWGEVTQGTIFRPVDVKNKVKGVSRTTARFPIRSGPKQFAAYLNDMNGLVIDVLSGPDMVPVARAQIEHIGTLAPSRPINGFFPVFSADSEKVAELQVSIVLESLMASYDSQSSVPTTDMSQDIHGESAEPQPGVPPKVAPQPSPALYSSADDPFRSPGPYKTYKKSETNATSHNVDPSQVKGSTHLAHNQVETSTSYPHSSQRDENLRNTMDSNASTLKGISSLQSEAMSGAVEEKIVSASSGDKKSYSGWESSDLKGPASSGTSVDIVSALIEKGSKLREAMIISTLDPHHVPRSDYMPSTPLIDREPSSGNLFKEILKPVKSDLTPDKADILDMADVEHTAVNLVLDDHINDSEFRMLKALQGSVGSSVSGDDAALDESDIGDPIHDNSLLEELFYKNDSDDSDDLLSGIDDVSPPARRSRSWNSMSSLDDPGNARPPSRQSSTSSMALDREPVRESDPVPTRSRSRTKSKSKTPTSTKKKSRSRSRSRSVSEERGQKKKPKKKSSQQKKIKDPDLLRSPRISESGSRISFNTSDHQSSVSLPRDGLSIERLTLLGRVHVARVVIDKYILSEDMVLDTPLSTPRSRARASRGKPPRPQTPKTKYTYFIEYQFPVVAASGKRKQLSATATEVMRVVSKKITDNVVSFGHRSVFPVMFDGDAIEKWWKSAVIFKVYAKTAGQKVPRLLGMASVPLKSVLKSESLFIDRSVEVKDRSMALSRSESSQAGNDGLWPVVGNLKISIELASDHKDFSNALAKTRLAEMSNPKIIPIPPPRPRSRSPKRKTSRERDGLGSTAGTQTEPQSTNIYTLPFAPPSDPPVQPRTNIYHQGELATAPTESLTLHTLLYVPEGMNITLQGIPSVRHGDRLPSQPPKSITSWTGRDAATRNLYLVSRMFWCDDFVKSCVCWGTCDPQFNLIQVVPMLLTASLLERMRNNFMVIEVWDKKTTAENDQLVGIVKLPLHQFYMSYRDRRIATSLLRSQFPVISVDNDLPIVNPFSGKTFGRLKVLLAIGSIEQVTNLQKMKAGQLSAISTVSRPEHYLERYNVYGEGMPPEAQTIQDNIVEHIFEVCIEGVKGLQLLDNMIWGEADCFIQYHFPAQKQVGQHDPSGVLHLRTLSLQTFRTATTLCIPDPVFSDVLKHKITLPEGTPVQKEILTACAGVGGGTGGVPFEVWCRYYYPNVRDQVIAKGLLPLAKLCAMITMQRRGEQSIQTYTITLTSLTPESNQQDTNSNKLPECGLLEVTINYRSSTHRVDSENHIETLSRSLPSATVCLAVSIIRASGLKAAAKALAKRDGSMQYVSEVGVNTYIRVKLSFLQKEDERVTRTVARTFAPEFGCHFDFPCTLLWTEVGCDALSLAEILESAEAVFELWHQAPRAAAGREPGVINTGSTEVRARRLITVAGDILLGTVTVPLLGLLTKKTGISGWFSVTLPSLGWDQTLPDADFSQSDEGHHGNRGLERVVGGLELSVKFAHHDDLNLVVHAARGVGWAPDFDVEHRDWESADEMLDHFHRITISVDLCIFPLQNALVTGQTKLDKAARCYVRYKFYDKGAVCSKFCPLEPNEDDYVTADLQHSKTLIIAGSAPFSWYLREEHLEIQIWVTFNSEGDQKQRPRNRDKLIGSAYIDMTSLADSRRRQHRVSGVYPLFKPGSSYLGGACVRAHISVKPHTGELVDSDVSDYEVETKQNVSRHLSPTIKPSAKTQQDVIIDLSNTFPVHIAIERAFHLPSVTENSETVAPSSYVSYQTADKSDLSFTEICPNNTNPIWNHDHDTRLSNDLLSQGTKNLVFKVWHKPTGLGSEHDKTVDKVLGFVSVDLSPLMAGFQKISGWYNIMDFSGHCQGQIKISVIPQELVTNLKSSTSSPAAVQSLASSTGQSYITQAVYPTFPTHLTWYPEQHITLNSNGSTATTGVCGENLPHFSEHYENVKKHHEQLRQTMQHMGINDPNTASRSILFNNLRTNLEELDQITNRLKQKLYQTNPPSSFEETRTEQQNLNELSAGFMSTSNIQTTTASLHPSSDTEQLRCDGMDNVLSDKGLESTGQTQGYEAGPEDNGASTFNTQQELLSTQDTELSSGLAATGMERSENDQTLFSATLHQAHQMLEAIHQAQEMYNNHKQDRNNSETASQETVTPYTGTANQVTNQELDNEHYTRPDSSPLDLQDQQDGYGDTSDHVQATDEMTDACFTHGNGEQDSEIDQVHEVEVDDTGQKEENEDDWEEEDTFSKAWAARQSDRQSDIVSELSAEDEDVIVPQKPLNDISSATFLNGYDDSFRQPASENILNAEQSLQGMEETDKPASKMTSQNSTDTFFATHETTWQGHLDTGDNLGLSQGESAEEQVDEYTESHRSTDSKSRNQIEGERVSEEPVDDQRCAQSRNVTDVSPSSASSQSGHGSRNGRKAAMIRREYEQCHIADSSSSGDEELMSRSLSKRKQPKSSGRGRQPSNGLHNNGVDKLEKRNAELVDNGMLHNDDHTQPETAIEINGQTNGDTRTKGNMEMNGSVEASCAQERYVPSQNNQDSGQMKNSGGILPNFFLPPEDLAQTLRALTTSAQYTRHRYKNSSGITNGKTDDTSKKIPREQLGHQTSLPSQEQAQRIAKIFSQKFS